ncbi:hypothetical protein [Streptomyces sp. t99]|uniref:hypothetical protein n=1 Tax=Streptomyces sp. t99 TaxID=1828172 RepID=UPI000BFBC196|nr:hypothetical protein [Streptomyces sp. t99]
MPEEKKQIRRIVSHADCDHEDSKMARRECRTAARHAQCEHDDSGQARAWCTRRRNKDAQEKE